jgi:hypothetical protein
MYVDFTTALTAPAAPSSIDPAKIALAAASTALARRTSSD